MSEMEVKEVLTSVRLELATLSERVANQLGKSAEYMMRFDKHVDWDRGEHSKLHNRITHAQLKIAALVGGGAAILGAVELFKAIR